MQMEESGASVDDQHLISLYEPARIHIDTFNTSTLQKYPPSMFIWLVRSRSLAWTIGMWSQNAEAGKKGKVVLREFLSTWSRLIWDDVEQVWRVVERKQWPIIRRKCYADDIPSQCCFWQSPSTWKAKVCHGRCNSPLAINENSEPRKSLAWFWTRTESGNGCLCFCDK